MLSCQHALRIATAQLYMYLICICHCVCVGTCDFEVLNDFQPFFPSHSNHSPNINPLLFFYKTNIYIYQLIRIRCNKYNSPKSFIIFFSFYLFNFYFLFLLIFLFNFFESMVKIKSCFLRLSISIIHRNCIKCNILNIVHDLNPILVSSHMYFTHAMIHFIFIFWIYVFYSQQFFF